MKPGRRTVRRWSGGKRGARALVRPCGEKLGAANGCVGLVHRCSGGRFWFSFHFPSNRPIGMRKPTICRRSRWSSKSCRSISPAAAWRIKRTPIFAM